MLERIALSLACLVAMAAISRAAPPAAAHRPTAALTLPALVAVRPATPAADETLTDMAMRD